MAQQQKVSLITLVILAGFTAAVLVHYMAGAYANMLYPYNTFLFKPQAVFLDFAHPYLLANDPYGFHAGEPADSSSAERIESPSITTVTAQSVRGPLYFPVAYQIARLFTVFSPGVALFLFLALSVGFFFFIAWQTLQTLGAPIVYSQVFILAFLSYPFLFALDRANFELIVFAFLFLFAEFYATHPRLGLICLALAIAMKGIPAIFLLIYAADRKYRALLVAGGLAAGMTLVGYAIYPGGLAQNISTHLLNLSVSNQSFTAGNNGFYFGNSLYGALKFIVLVVAPLTDLNGWTNGFHLPYLILSGCLLLGVASYGMFVEKIFWKRMALLVCLMNLLPSISGDYKLIHLYIPLLLFIQTPARGARDKWYALVLALLLVPKDYFHLPLYPEASSSILLNPLLMLLLIALILADGIQRQRHQVVPVTP